MIVRFAPPDPAYDHQCLENYFFNVILPDDDIRDEAEEATRETLFDKLTELESVIRDLKKRARRG